MNKKPIDFNTKKLYMTETIKWCKKFFGVNKRKRTKLFVVFTPRKRSIKKSMVYGNYCFFRNKITIHEPACETIDDIVSTVIHEYTHYLQSRTLYKIYQDKYNYSNNPYEKEAKRNEEKYTKMCIKDIKKLI